MEAETSILGDASSAVCEAANWLAACIQQRGLNVGGVRESTLSYSLSCWCRAGSQDTIYLSGYTSRLGLGTASAVRPVFHRPIISSNPPAKGCTACLPCQVGRRTQHFDPRIHVRGLLEIMHLVAWKPHLL